MTHADETKAAAANIEHEWDAHALEWPLTTESTVIDVGGYKGRWALQIAERYHPRLFVFEPQGWAAVVCHEVLGNQALVWGCALGVRDERVPMTRWETDGCTLINGDGPEVVMREIGGMFRELGIDSIDLMMMNIEGYEYTLILHMLDRGILPLRLMVQFHGFADPDGVGLSAIHERMSTLGYTIPWTYGPLLTAWERGDKQSAPPKRKVGRPPKASK